MKDGSRVIAIVLALIALPALAAERLVTESFDVSIDVRCKEGVVGCDRVKFVGVERKTGKTIRLNGREVHTTCADGVTPCRFLGYEFKSGGTTYSVWENGALEIRRNRKVVLEEQGAWQ